MLRGSESYAYHFVDYLKLELRGQLTRAVGPFSKMPRKSIGIAKLVRTEHIQYESLSAGTVGGPISLTASRAKHLGRFGFLSDELNHF